MTVKFFALALILSVTLYNVLAADEDVPRPRNRRLRLLQDNGQDGPIVRRRIVRPGRPGGRPLRRGNFGLRRQRPRQRRTTTTTTTTTKAPDFPDYYDDDYYNDYYYDYIEPISTTTTTTTTSTTRKPKPRGRRPLNRIRPGANRRPYDPSRYRNRRPRPRNRGPAVTLGPPIQPPTEVPPPTKKTEPTTTTTTTTTTEGPTSPPRKDGRKINWLYDPNRPRELGDFDLTDYPFYIRVPENITFKCEDHMDGFFASIPHRCQVFHYCFGGYKYDFLCPNYTLYDQTTFTCRFVNMVKCQESESHYNRNVGLFVETKQKPASTETESESEDKKEKRRKKKHKKHNKRRPETEETEEETYEDSDYDDEDYYSEEYSDEEDEKKR